MFGVPGLDPRSKREDEKEMKEKGVEEAMMLRNERYNRDELFSITADVITQFLIRAFKMTNRTRVV
jgi:hypothetical protein